MSRILLANCGGFRILLFLAFVYLAGSLSSGLSKDFQSIARSEPPGRIVSFEAQVLSKKRHDREDGLIETAFRLYENSKEKRIVSVQQERKPLSLMFVVTLGVNGDCGYLEIESYLWWLGEALNRNLKAGDEIAVALTNPSGQLLLKFGETKERFQKVFGINRYGKGEIAHISNLDGKLVSGRVVVSSATASDPYRETQVKGDILMYPLNYLHTSTQNAIAHLSKDRNPNNRPVLIFCNSIYNLAPVGKGEIEAIEQQLYKLGISVGWIGEPLPYLSRFFLPHYKDSGVQIQGKITKFYEQQYFWQNREPWIQLPEKTGGSKINCDPFNPIYDPSDGRQDFEKEVFLFIDNLRTRYKITYESDNPDLTQLRNIKLEMSLKWKGGKVTLHYPQVIYPQAQEK